jgi:ABC-type transporter Mla MlaB component
MRTNEIAITVINDPHVPELPVDESGNPTERELMLRIEIQSWNGVATLHCSGRVVFGVEAEMLRTIVQSRPESSLRVSLAGVEKIDATGLGLLVELQNWAADTGRNLVLIDLSLPVWRLVILSKLCASLEISYSDIPQMFECPDQCDQREMIA